MQVTMNQLYRQSGSKKPFKEWVDEYKYANADGYPLNPTVNADIEKLISQNTGIAGGIKLNPVTDPPKKLNTVLGIHYGIWLTGVTIIVIATIIKNQQP